MDPALRKEKEAFKKRAIAAADRSQKSREAAKAKASVQSVPHRAKKTSKKQNHSIPNTGAAPPYCQQAVSMRTFPLEANLKGSCNLGRAMSRGTPLVPAKEASPLLLTRGCGFTKRVSTFLLHDLGEKDPRDKNILEENLDRIKSAAQTAHRSNNPHRVLKSIMDMMKERYTGKNYEPLSLDDIFAAIELEELKPDLKLWIQDALANNPKIMFHPEEGQYLFRPALGHSVRNRKQLLSKLYENEVEGSGGIMLADIKEAVHSYEKALKRLVEDECVICISRQDKEQVVFYNNPEYSLGQEVSEEFQGLWHRVSVEGVTEIDIEKYLDNVGLGAMQGESRKRKMPGNSSKKSRKKAKQAKVMNTHLDDKLLKDYTEDAKT